MKRILLIGLSACALTLNAHAQHIDVTGNIHHWVHDPGMEILGDASMRKELREEAKEWAEYQAALAQAETEHEKQIQKMYRDQDLRNQARDVAFAEDAKSNPFYRTDPLPLSNTYDDIATIKMYLHDSGYIDLSDAQIANVITYMKANGVHHVSELSELTKALEASSKAS